MKPQNITKFKTIGSCRTDAGVHALSQAVLLESGVQLPESVFLKGVNQRLPSDIKINQVCTVDDNFHPIFSSKSKTYMYVLALDSLPPFLSSNFLQYTQKVNMNFLLG